MKTECFSPTLSKLKQVISLHWLLWR